MAKGKRRKKRTAVDVILTIILLAAIGVFCYAGYNLITIYLQYKEGRDQYADMANMVVTERDPDAMPEGGSGGGGSSAGAGAAAGTGADAGNGEGDASQEVIIPPISVDFGKLKSINDDVIGWLYLEAFDDFSYPITRGVDNEYYLHRNIYKEYLYAGTVFADKLNSDDLNDCYNILYGHNMKDGSMFGRLSEFITDPLTMTKSHYFWIFTPGKTERYEIISVYNAPVNGDTYTSYKGPGKEYQDFLSRVQTYSEVYFPPADLNVRDKLMCLSTCLDNHDYSKRCVVIGKLVNVI